MNARSTVSGTNSVLMDPCRKKSRSARDQSGTWAMTRAVEPDPAGGGLSSSAEFAMEIKQARAVKTAGVTGEWLDFMSIILAGCPRLVKFHTAQTRPRMPE